MFQKLSYESIRRLHQEYITRKPFPITPTKTLCYSIIRSTNNNGGNSFSFGMSPLMSASLKLSISADFQFVMLFATVAFIFSGITKMLRISTIQDRGMVWCILGYSIRANATLESFHCNFIGPFYWQLQSQKKLM